MTAETHEASTTVPTVLLPLQRSIRELVPAIPVRRRIAWQTTYVAALLVLDSIAVMVAGVAGVAVRHEMGGGRFATAVPHLYIILATAPLWVGAIAVSGGYTPHILGRGTTEYKRIFDATLRFSAAVALIAYLLHLTLARSTVLVALPLACLLCISLRTAARKVLARRRGQGLALQRVLVIGHETSAFATAAQLSKDTGAGFDVVGVCAPDGSDRRRTSSDRDGADRRRVQRWSVVGDFDDVPGLVGDLAADAIVVSPSPALSGERLRQLAWDVEKRGVDLLVAPALVDVAGPRVHVSPVEGQLLLHVERPNLTGITALAKVTIDRLIALVALVLLLPVLAVTALVVKLDSRGPAFFRQVRVGRGGRNFTMYKFRSMYINSEDRLADVLESNNHGSGPLFKMDNDPRVTRVGRFLRRCSLDELPQLLNVVLGSMSLVGPRPPLPREVEQYGVSHVYRRLMVRPGITGLWQVSGRADLEWSESVRLDLYYVENWSLTLDLGILWKTLGAVLKGRGAY